MVSQTENGLQVSVEEVAAWSRRLVITVPAERVRSERTRVVREISKKARIPGFRKGKVPPRHIEARFGEEIDRRTRTNVIQDAFGEAVRQTGLEPINEPRVANVSFGAESELTFEVAFDIWPKIQLGRVSGFRVQRPAVEVSEDEIGEQLQRLRHHAVWKGVERRPGAGDSVVVEITPLEEAEAEEDSRTHRFVLGEGQAIQDVEDAIMSLEPGGTDEFTVTFPQDAADEARRGKSQRLRISLKEVLESELPEIDDELARQVGELESVEALRAAIRDELERQGAEDAEEQVEHQLVDQVVQANAFEVPDSWVDREVERYLQAVIGEETQASEEQLQRLRQEARPAAIWGIKRTLILRQLAEDQGLEASKEELEGRVRSIAQRAERPEPEVRARLARSGELDRIRQRLTERKVLDFLKAQSEIEEGRGSTRPE